MRSPASFPRSLSRSPYLLRNSLRTLYAKIFLWFCATIVVTTIVALATAAFTGTQPLGRRWMALTQDLYAHSAVDFFTTGGGASLQRYLDALAMNTGIDGQLLDGDGHDVLGGVANPDTAAVLEQSRQTGRSRLRVGRVWTAASPVSYTGARYTFVMAVHPMRGLFRRGFLDGSFANGALPRIMVGVLVIAVFCLLLARHITQPIRSIENAAMKLAGGDLSVRVGPQIAPRQDELASMAAAFDQMAERIQGLIHAQQEMLGHVSHELRSPLTRMGVSLELMRRGEVDSLDQMQMDLDRLNQMIGEILEITRMDIQGPLNGYRSPPIAVDLAPLLKAIAEDASFESREMKKSVVLESEGSCVVLGDPALLRSCCENVIRNALLYSEDGTSIRIRLDCDATNGRAAIVIQDEGPGVPAKALPRIFEMFYRAGNAPEKHPGGTGFGLAITQRIVTMHRGTIAARNLAPHGLEVRIELPLASHRTGV